jgi:hypothetical protein
MGVVIGIAIAVIVLFVIGYATYPIGGYSNFGNDNVEGCTKACANLVAKRNQTCGQRVAVSMARSAMVAAGMLFAGAAAASLAASIAAGAAAAIPIVGFIVAAALATYAAALAAYSNYLLGRYAAACTAYAIQSQGLADAMRLESDALKLVNDSCPPEVATACIAGLPVCPV